MKKQTYNLLFAGVMILLLTACGQSKTASTPAPDRPATENPAPVENIPTDVLTNTSNPEQFRKYIGTSHPPLPEGLSEGISMLIQDKEDHGLFLVSEGDNKMLWLSKLDHYDSNGNAYWEVKDVLDLSNAEAGLSLLPDGCSRNGAPDSEIIVAGKEGTIRLAWRANTTLDRFEVILTEGIECHSDKAIAL